MATKKDGTKIELMIQRPEPNLHIHSLGPRQPSPGTSTGPRQPQPSAPTVPPPPVKKG